MCFVLSSTGPFKFQWSKDGKNISNMAEVKVNNNNEYSVIIIDPVKLTSEGNYTCTVSNHVGSSSYTASFLVAGKIFTYDNQKYIILISYSSDLLITKMKFYLSTTSVARRTTRRIFCHGCNQLHSLFSNWFSGT